MKRSLILFAFFLISVVLICIGCKKKEDQGTKPPADANTQTQPQTQELPEEPEEDIEPPPPPEAAPETPQSTGRNDDATQPSAKNTRRLPLKGIKPAGPAGSVTPLTPEEFKQFDALESSDDKKEFISEFIDANPEAIAQLVNKALDDKDPDVRLEAMEALVGQEASGPGVIDAVKKALMDESENVRESAVEACGYLNEPEAGEMLAQAVNDASEDVRTSAIQAADEKEAPVRLNVLKAGLSSRYEDVKEASVSSLIDVSTHEAVDALLSGLKDPNPEFRETVSDALDFLIGQEFKTYDEGARWWRTNRDRFDEELNEKD